MNTIARPFGMLLMFLYDITSNYGIAVILFAVIVKLILLPFQMKSKRGTMRMSLLTPKMQELQKKYQSNQQKYNEEVQKLYKEEGASPMSGCIWSLIPFPILIALYYAIRQPLTTMMGISSSLISEGGAIYEKMISLGYETVSSQNSYYSQIFMSKFISEHFESFEGMSDKLRQIQYTFLGLDLGATPNYKFWGFDWSNLKEALPEFGLFLIPVVAAVLTYLSSVIAQKMNPSAAGTSSSSMTIMNLIMPLMTLWLGFMMPAAVCLYWGMSSLLGMVQDIILTKYYTKVLAAESAQRDEERRQREAELEAKRQETERLKAANATSENVNTSKKKLQAKENAEKARKQAEWEKAHAQEEATDEEPSRVGYRKYARGHSYDPHRYDHNFENLSEDNEDEDGNEADRVRLLVSDEGENEDTEN